MTWPKVRLGSLCDVFTGRKDVNQAHPKGKYRFFSCAPTVFYSDEYLHDGPAILVAGNGSYTGRVSFYNGKFDLYQRTYACVPKTDVEFEIKYVLYFMELTFLATIRGRTHGAAIPYIVKADLTDYEIPLPPLPVQQKIADILGAYDDLIENNRRRIELLEKMARELYRERFVRRRGSKFEEYPLERIAKFVRGKVIVKDATVKGNVPVVAGGLEPAYYHNTANTNAPVITVSGSGANAGFARMYYEKVWASDCSWIDATTTKYIHFVYCFLKDNDAILRNAQKGAAQPHVHAKDVNALMVCTTEDEMKAFEDCVTPLFAELASLEMQNRNLAKQRDRLLPRLMSGKLDVSKLVKEGV